MASKSDIANFALSHCGISQFVANIDTDQSKPARVCKKWYDTALSSCLGDTDWNFTRRYENLALLAGLIPSHWTYKYAYPAQCAFMRAIMPPGIRLPTIKERIPFEVSSETIADTDTMVIYTDQQNAVARFSKVVVNESLFTPDFVLALSYLLGSLIAVPLTVKPAIADSLRKAYLDLIQQAEAGNYNEGQDGPEPDNELAKIREGAPFDPFIDLFK